MKSGWAGASNGSRRSGATLILTTKPRSRPISWPKRERFIILRSRILAFQEREGVSIFYKDRNGDIFHTYSTYARGIDMMNVDYQYLDLVPKGRDENGKGPFWVRRHDEYGQGS